VLIAFVVLDLVSSVLCQKLFSLFFTAEHVAFCQPFIKRRW